MKLVKNLIIAFILFLLTLFFVIPAFAHGEDPEEGESTAQIADGGDGHSDNNPHSEGDDDHGDGSGNTSFAIGGIIGATLLALSAAFMFFPRPSMLVLIGLALIGATGVIHIMVGVNWGVALLLLNGIGFLGLGVVWAMPNEIISNQQRIIVIVLAIYTLITILGYFFTHDHYDFVAILTKVIEALLLIILAISILSPEKSNIDLKHG